MSIVRVGLAETRKFAEGYEAIFGKQATEAPTEAPAKAKGKADAKKSAKKKAAAKKAGKKK